ncbi:hypothetical protein KEM60_02696 [Austwickia sp. TVS 96-490-7B]|uniref:antitoxin n=1 Tax=Austwickia sp. TVS 96-490-7B TaxID=2830843 RepID=UPI001C5930C7|nr:antitoxin [Austwickia sp. TVS 96-490-7B]MBW3086475.1 hypothetical protein [Austwickia sp. TVS 96-490-7B]
MSIFDNLKDKASEVLRNEELTDQALDRVADLAKGVAGDHADKVDKAREVLDGRLGNE